MILGSRFGRKVWPRYRASAFLLLIAIHLTSSVRAQNSAPSLTRRFVDVTRSAGIDFHLTAGSPEKKLNCPRSITRGKETD